MVQYVSCLTLCAVLPLFASTNLSAAAAVAPDDETKKIEALIDHIEGLKEAKFVRNDIEYDAKTAAAFLRGKWNANKAKIKSAQVFIEQVATKSSTTGKPYLIRLKSGQEHESGTYLAERLKALDSGAD